MLPAPRQQQAGVLSFQQLLKQYQRQIAVALPKHMSADRMMRVALTAYNQTPDLQLCDPLTLIAAVIQASQLGLEPGIPILGHAYLIPFKNFRRKDTPYVQGRGEWAYTLEAQLLVGYKGYLELGRRSGRCKQFGANNVHAYDEFSLWYDPAPQMVHKPLFTKTANGVLVPLPPDERGEIVGVYGYVQTLQGDANVEFLTIHEVLDARDRFSKSGAADDKHPDGKGVWLEHFPTMVRKTGVRRVAKWAPLSPELHLATGLDDAHDAGISQQLVAALDLEGGSTERGSVITAVQTTQPGGPGDDVDDSAGGGNGADSGPADPPEPTGTRTAAGTPTSAQQPQQQPQQQQQQPQQPQQPRGLTIDDFDPQDFQVVQANLKAAGMNRAAMLSWLGQFNGGPAAAVEQSEVVREKYENGGRR
jgi:recombination protein RecT